MWSILVFILERNWVFATNSDFLIPISLQPNVVTLRYFKQWILLDQKICVWNWWMVWTISLQRYTDKKKIRFCQRLNYFGYCIQISSLLSVKKVFFIIWTFYDIFLSDLNLCMTHQRWKMCFFKYSNNSCYFLLDVKLSSNKNPSIPVIKSLKRQL